MKPYLNRHLYTLHLSLLLLLRLDLGAYIFSYPHINILTYNFYLYKCLYTLHLLLLLFSGAILVFEIGHHCLRFVLASFLLEICASLLLYWI